MDDSSARGVIDYTPAVEPASLARMQFARFLVRIVVLCAATALFSGGALGDTTAVHASPHAIEPLQPGARVPTVAVETVGGELVDLAELVRESGALLVFYRGGW